MFFRKIMLIKIIVGYNASIMKHSLSTLCMIMILGFSTPGWCAKEGEQTPPAQPESSSSDSSEVAAQDIPYMGAEAWHRVESITTGVEVGYAWEKHAMEPYEGIDCLKSEQVLYLQGPPVMDHTAFVVILVSIEYLDLETGYARYSKLISLSPIETSISEVFYNGTTARVVEIQKGQHTEKTYHPKGLPINSFNSVDLMDITLRVGNQVVKNYFAPQNNKVLERRAKVAEQTTFSLGTRTVDAYVIEITDVEASKLAVRYIVDARGNGLVTELLEYELVTRLAPKNEILTTYPDALERIKESLAAK